jgi:hypothetical protein
MDCNNKVYLVILIFGVVVATLSHRLADFSLNISSYEHHNSTSRPTADREDAGQWKPHANSFNGTWDPLRDSRNLMLTASQCQIAFSDLTHEIDRAAKHRSNSRITPEELHKLSAQDGSYRAIIYENEVCLVLFQRNLSTLLGKIALYTREAWYERRDAKFRNYASNPPRHGHFTRTPPQYRICVHGGGRVRRR